jgi:uncharacterized repeat protein (TIGR03806 family)
MTRILLLLMLVSAGCAEDAGVATADAIADGAGTLADGAVADVQDAVADGDGAADNFVEPDLWTPPDVVADISCAPSCTDLLPPGVGASPCHLDGDLPEAAGVTLVPVFAKAGLTQPIFLGPWGDGTDRLFVVQRSGKVVLIDNDPATTKPPLTVLDVSALVNTAGEGGLLSAAMHPKFKQNRKMYVSLTKGTPMHSQILEYVVGADDVATPSTQRLVIDVQQPNYTNHKGGFITFDVKGMLLFGLGDGGSANDPSGNGQNKKTMLAKILRIDPDSPANGMGYGIPKDNPFVGNSAFLPEIFTWGMRNPWRFSVDRLTGEIWAGDVGQDTWEEVDKIVGGQNYGWNTMEASHCFPPNVTTCKQDGLTLPLAEYKHPYGKSITGGYVYRGSQQKSLYGKYIFADYDQGRLFTLPTTGLTPTELAKATFQPVSFGEDRDGELYIMQLYGPLGLVFKIVEAPPKPAGKPLPLLLSQTQCFSDVAMLQPAAGVVPYDVNVPLWSDGAGKQRFLVLPQGAKPGTLPVSVPDDPYASWNLPLGTLLIKHFALGDTATPAETRFLRRDADGWKFFTYRWKADGSDADLLPGGGGEATFDVTLAGQKAKQTWRYPQMADCASCHHAAGSFESQVLGVQTAQLNRPGSWAGKPIPNLVVALRDAGLISQSTLTNVQFPALPDLSNVKDVPNAARAWLHANCSHCHRPQGAAPSDMDLRFGTPLSQGHACGAAAENGTVNGATQLLAPGQPESSVLLQRLQSPPSGGLFMPQIAVSMPEPGAAELISAWITGLASCAP